MGESGRGLLGGPGLPTASLQALRAAPEGVGYESVAIVTRLQGVNSTPAARAASLRGRVARSHSRTCGAIRIDGAEVRHIQGPSPHAASAGDRTATHHDRCRRGTGTGCRGLTRPFDTTDGMEPDHARNVGACSNVLREEHKIPGRSLDLSVAGPCGLVESGPELHTELVMATRGCSWNPIGNKGRYPMSAASAPNSTRQRDWRLWRDVSSVRVCPWHRRADKKDPS